MQNKRNIACELVFDKTKGVDIRLADEFADKLDDVKSIMCDTLGVGDDEEKKIKLDIGITNHSFAIVGSDIDYGPNDENYHSVCTALQDAVQKRLYEMYGVQYDVEQIDASAGGYMDRFKFIEKPVDEIRLSKEEKEIISKYHPIQNCAKSISALVSEYVQSCVDEENNPYIDDETMLIHIMNGFKSALGSSVNVTPYTSDDLDSIENLIHIEKFGGRQIEMDVYFKNGTMLYEFSIDEPIMGSGTPPAPASLSPALVSNEPIRIPEPKKPAYAPPLISLYEPEDLPLPDRYGGPDILF